MAATQGPEPGKELSMSNKAGPYDWIVKLARITLFVFLGLLALAFVGTIILTIVVATRDPSFIFYGVLTVLGEAALAGAAIVAYGLVKLLVATEDAATSTARRTSRIETLSYDQAESLKKLVDISSLSDQAKSLIYRDREIDALREAIHEDLIRQDYDSAESLIEGVEKRSGFADEANRLRQQLGDSRKATLEEKIDAAIGRIQQTIDRHEWDRAQREAHRVMRLFPKNPKVAALGERIESARANHKRSLLQAYAEAVRKNDVDQSIAMLKELDLYLSPQEAAALEESARGVFKARLHQLGVQFAIRVTDQQWSDAIAAGENIISEFPNSRMAQEVREKMELLRSRSEAAALAPLQPQAPVNK